MKIHIVYIYSHTEVPKSLQHKVIHPNISTEDCNPLHMQTILLPNFKVFIPPELGFVCAEIFLNYELLLVWH